MEAVTADYVLIRTRKGVNRIARQKIKEAICFFYHCRTVIRKQLETFTRFNSALFGLLRLAFHKITKWVKTPKGYWRLSMTDQIHYFSGLCRAPRDMLLAKENGATHILISYHFVRTDPNEWWLYYAQKYKLQILIDPGEYSRYKAEISGQDISPITVSDYATFILKHKEKIQGYLSLDVIENPEQSHANFRELVEIIGENFPPIPVWHVQSEWKYLEEIMKLDPPVVAIGGSAFLSEQKRNYIFRELFDRFQGNFHALGLSSRLMFTYPWFSSDSSAWLQGRKSHSLLTTSGQVKAPADWTTEECLQFNVQTLVHQLQQNYDRRFQTSLLIKPIQKLHQLTLF